MNSLFRLISLNAARVLFVGVLLLALYVGLTWALAVEERPDAASIAAAEVARAQAAEELAASEAAAAEEALEADTDEGAATPEPTPIETIPPEELIAAAKPPGETTVQVLDAGGGTATVDAVIAALEANGYQVVAVNSSSRDVSVTTVYYTEGDEAQAEGLRARDPRFQEVEPNQGLSEGVDIHVLVGSGFSG